MVLDTIVNDLSPSVRAQMEKRVYHSHEIGKILYYDWSNSFLSFNIYLHCKNLKKIYVL